MTGEILMPFGYNRIEMSDYYENFSVLYSIYCHLDHEKVLR